MKKNKKIIVFIILIVTILSISGITVNAVLNNKDQIKYGRLETIQTAELSLSDKYENLFEKENVVVYKYSNDDIKVYTDRENTEYLVENKELVGFIKEIEPNEVVIRMKSLGISKQKAYEIAKEYCENNISDFEQYDFIENKYIESYKEYNIVFNRKIGNYQTMDLIFIAINTTGEITAFLATNQGKFNNFNDINVDENKVSQYIENELNNNYNNGIESFIEYDKTFKIVENKLTLECLVEVILKDGTTIVDIVNYYI